MPIISQATFYAQCTHRATGLSSITTATTGQTNIDNVSSIGSGAGMLHPVAGRVFRRGLNFKNCTNTLNIFLTIPGIFAYSQVYLQYETKQVFNV